MRSKLFFKPVLISVCLLSLSLSVCLPEQASVVSTSTPLSLPTESLPTAMPSPSVPSLPIGMIEVAFVKDDNIQVAAQGDPVALEIIRWAGRELGEMAVTVIRQLEFQSIDFDLVQIGSMFDGSPLLTEEMKKVVHAVAPEAKFIRTYAPPVMGAVLLGMEVAGIQPGAQVRGQLTASITSLHWNGKPGG